MGLCVWGQIGREDAVNVDGRFSFIYVFDRSGIVYGGRALKRDDLNR